MSSPLASALWHSKPHSGCSRQGECCTLRQLPPSLPACMLQSMLSKILEGALSLQQRLLHGEASR